MQSMTKEQFFEILHQNDVLSIIDPCISSPYASVRTATIELLTMLVDFNPNLFREYINKQFRQIPESKNESLLINKLINQMLNDRDPEFTAASQMSQVLRVLLDPSPQESTASFMKVEKTEFLPLFYKRAMYSLCKPILDNIEDEKFIKDDYFTANRLSLVIDLLCFLVDHHSYSMRIYIIQKNLLRSVLVCLKSRHHFLAHYALRLLRRVIGLKDELYIRHICDKQILDMVVECFAANPRYNLMNSAIIELFEHIRSEEIRPLIEYVIKNHWESTLKNITYVPTFSAMKTRYDAYMEYLASNGETAQKDENIAAYPNQLNPQWKKEQEHENDELFFSKDDEEMPLVQQRKFGNEPMFPSIVRKRKVNDDNDNLASIFGGSLSQTPIQAPNPAKSSKIVIRMNSIGGLEKSADSKGTNGNVAHENEKMDDHDELSSPIVSSSSSPSKSFSSELPEYDLTPANDSAPNNSQKDSSQQKGPVILKKGLSGLVDYEIDEDSDESGDEEESGRTEKEDRKGISPKKLAQRLADNDIEPSSSSPYFADE